MCEEKDVQSYGQFMFNRRDPFSVRCARCVQPGLFKEQFFSLLDRNQSEQTH